jgi:prepilin-type N-terminal cleavage/methylation domain-containing protein
MRRLRLRDERGVTLIEMIMVLAILGIVLGGVTTVFISGSRAELNVNNRFQAQEASRLAMAAIRNDTHSSCAAAINAGKTQLTLSIPVTNKATTPPTPPNATTQCGTINAGNITKVIWCVLTSPTVSTKFAVYRSTASTCTSSSKLVADNLINTLGNFAGFFKPTLIVATGAINWGETQTVDVDIPVSLKQGQAGAPFDLQERLAISNTVWSTTAAQSCSASVPCIPGPCDYLDVALAHAPCYPIVIS